MNEEISWRNLKGFWLKFGIIGGILSFLATIFWFVVGVMYGI